MKAMRNQLMLFAHITVAMMGGTVSLATECYTWDDPPGTRYSTYNRDCNGCGAWSDFRVQDPGVHWVCKVVPTGWPGCKHDSACEFVESGNCPYCGYFNRRVLNGPYDQLVDGQGKCPPE